MKKRVLADTNIWIDYFNGDSDIADKLEQLIKKGAVFITGPVIYELLQGAKTSDTIQTLIETLNAVHYLDSSKRHWEKAGILSSDLRRKGITIPMSDILISVIAAENNCMIFTQDSHFKSIPGVTLYK